MNEELLKKFLNDQCSQEEIKKIKSWANSPNNKSQLFSLLEEKWKGLNVQTERDFVYENLFRKITDRISEKESTKSLKAIPAIQTSFRRYTGYFYYSKVAATVAIFIIVSVFFVLNFNSFQQNSFSSAIAYVTKSTSIGQKLTFRLPDGTAIILNAASSIKYPEHFSEGKREVFLSGEAFFNVVKDTASPFMVHSDNITTTALGTSFNIKATDNEVEVALTTGKVSVEYQDVKSRPNEKIYLYPGEMAIYKPKLKNIRKENFNVAEITAWKEGSIHFNHVPLNEIMKRLGQRYGVTISLDNKISGDKKLTGEFNNENLESILQGLCFSLECKYIINGKNVEIKLK